jgi:hypothetical protein
VPADFKQLVEALDATCHRFLKTEDAVTRDVLGRALAAYQVPVELAPPVAKGLAHVAATHADTLKHRLAHRQGPLEDVSVRGLVQKLCGSLADLKAVLEEQDRAAPPDAKSVNL